jgi:hypothetical protein
MNFTGAYRRHHLILIINKFWCQQDFLFQEHNIPEIHQDEGVYMPLVFAPVNKSDRSGALARRNESFDFDVVILAGLSERRIRPFVTNPTEKSIGNGRVVVGRALPQPLDDRLNLE